MPAEKIKKLTNILQDLGRLVVAYSGGVDSTFLLKMAVDTVGRDNVIAVTARSETYPLAEYKQAKDLAKKIGARHITVKTEEFKIKDFKSNPVNRCYYCKRELFKELSHIRDRQKMDIVVDGTTSDDLKDIRHGSKAAKELGVRTPLLEAGFTKKDIRRFSKVLKLPTWDKPSCACLASRIPFNNEITKHDLQKIEKAEQYLQQLGFKQVRVRLHGSIARIEIPEEDLNLGMRFKNLIIERFKSLGFTYIALDLEGYRTGSMHEAV